MQKVAIVGYGAYMDSGYGCAGEWRCLKAAALGEGSIGQPVQVVAFVKCECPGRSLAPNLGVAIKMSPIQLDEIYISSCMPSANPGSPYADADEMAEILKGKTGTEAVKGSHNYT